MPEIKLNLGSGENKLDGFVNIDTEPRTTPDLCLDFRYDPLPYQEEEVDEVWMLHCIEHVERKYWDSVFREIHRVLKSNGMLILSYPEFKICADYFIRDYRGQREFWHATLYGRQLYPADYHVTAIDTVDLKQFLGAYGFYKIMFKTESVEEDFNTTLIARRAPFELLTNREDVMNKEYNLKAHK